MKEESSLDSGKHTWNIMEHFKNNKDGIIFFLYIYHLRQCGGPITICLTCLLLDCKRGTSTSHTPGGPRR